MNRTNDFFSSIKAGLTHSIYMSMNPYRTLQSYLDEEEAPQWRSSASISAAEALTSQAIANRRETVSRALANCITRTDIIHYFRSAGASPLSPFVLVSERTAPEIVPHDQLPLEPIRSQTLGRDIPYSAESMPLGAALVCDLNDVIIRAFQFAGCFTESDNDYIPVVLDRPGILIFFARATQHIIIRVFIPYICVNGKSTGSLDKSFVYWIRSPAPSETRKLGKSQLTFFENKHKVVATTSVSRDCISNPLKTDLPPDPFANYTHIYSQVMITSCEVSPCILIDIFPKKKPRAERGRRIEITREGITLSGYDKDKVIILSTENQSSAHYRFIKLPDAGVSIAGKIMTDMMMRFGHAINLSRTKIRLEFYSMIERYYWLILHCNFGAQDAEGEVCVPITVADDIVGNSSPSPMPNSVTDPKRDSSSSDMRPCNNNEDTYSIDDPTGRVERNRTRPVTKILPPACDLTISSLDDHVLSQASEMSIASGILPPTPVIATPLTTTSTATSTTTTTTATTTTTTTTPFEERAITTNAAELSHPSGAPTINDVFTQSLGDTDSEDQSDHDSTDDDDTMAIFSV